MLLPFVEVSERTRRDRCASTALAAVAMHWKKENIARLSGGHVWLCMYWLSWIASVITLEKQAVLHHRVRTLKEHILSFLLYDKPCCDTFVMDWNHIKVCFSRSLIVCLLFLFVGLRSTRIWDLNIYIFSEKNSRKYTLRSCSSFSCNSRNSCKFGAGCTYIFWTFWLYSVTLYPIFAPSPAVPTFTFVFCAIWSTVQKNI